MDHYLWDLYFGAVKAYVASREGAASADEIFAAVVKEFSKHEAMPSPFLARVDALIDILYYIFDSWHCMDQREPAGVELSAIEREISTMYQQVAAFTRGKLEILDASERVKSVDEQVPFLLAMIGSELLEMRNVTATPEFCAATLSELKARYQTSDEPLSLSPMATIWAIVVCIVDFFNTAWPGLLQPAFAAVHGANMSKGVADATGAVKFTGKRVEVDGRVVVKIVKPAGWKECDLVAVIRRWTETLTWEMFAVKQAS